MMHFSVLTLFPGMFEGFCKESMLGKATEEGLIQIEVTNIRDYASGKHKVTDDYSFGGGCGMVMMAEPIIKATEAIKMSDFPGGSRVILTSPQGKSFKQEDAKRLASFGQIVIICGHYEGVDERVSSYIDEELSVGDFVLTGGEVPAMAIIDAVARMIPGVLSHESSACSDSFFEGLLDYPHYTRPRNWRGQTVPEVLVSGDHEKIRLFRRREALLRTMQRRPDLFSILELSEEDKCLLYGKSGKSEGRKTRAASVKEKAEQTVD